MEIKLSVNEVRHAMELWLRETFDEGFKITEVRPTNDGISVKLALTVERPPDPLKDTP